MEAKWFADTYEGALLHAASLYPEGDFHIVSADLPEAMIDRLYRDDNLDHFGPATCLELSDLEWIVPVLELE
jgi:hypothetical protein